MTYSNDLLKKEEVRATIDDFLKLDIRVGRIIAVDDFPETRKPAYKLTIDFGEEIGPKRSSAQVTKHYKKDDLIGKKVMGVVNLPPRQIGPFISEVLTLGVPDADHECVLIAPTTDDAFVGGRLF
ncbi:MAG: tRNA-binding protein [Patescibacteria group bacterium]